jgi:hypothetical protein
MCTFSSVLAVGASERRKSAFAMALVDGIRNPPSLKLQWIKEEIRKGRAVR